MTAPRTPLLVGGFVLLCLIWGTTWSVIQIGLAGIPPFSGVALRFALAAALILAVARWSGVRLGTSRRERALWLVNAALAFCGSYGILYWCEQSIPSGLAAVLFATYPLFVAILSHFLLPEEALSHREAVGIVVGFAGVGVIFSEDFGALGGPPVARAAAVMLLSPFVSAAASVAVKRWGAGVHPLSLAGVPMALAAGLMGALALWFERDAQLSWNVVSVSALLYLAIFGSAVTFTLYYWLLSQLPAKRLALISYVVPVVAVLLGVLRGERPTIKMLGGAVLVVIGVAFAVRRSGRNRGRPSAGGDRVRLGRKERDPDRTALAGQVERSDVPQS